MGAFVGLSGLPTRRRSGARPRRVFCQAGPSLPWAQEAGIRWNGMELHNFAGGLRGMIATEPVDPKVVAVTVPKQAVLESNSLPERNPVPSFVAGTYWRRQQWWVRLGLLLLAQKVARTNENLVGYVDSLPKSFDTPLHWSDERVAETQYPQLLVKVQRQRRMWRSLYDQFCEERKPLAADVDYDTFVWALECVRSRAFSGEVETTPLAERLRTLGFAGVLSVVALVFGLATSEQVLNGLSLALVGLLGYDIIYPRVLSFVQGEEAKRYILCPVVDFCNHRSDVKSDLSYEYFYSRFVLRAGPFEEGQQVFITYGERSNDQLLQFYGFVEEDNPNDVYVFGDTLKEVLGRLGDGEATIDESAPDIGPIVLYKQSLDFDEPTKKALAAVLGSADRCKYLLELLCKSELENMPTSLEDDLMIKKRTTTVQFRIEKKKLLQQALDALQA